MPKAISVYYEKHSVANKLHFQNHIGAIRTNYFVHKVCGTEILFIFTLTVQHSKLSIKCTTNVVLSATFDAF